MVKASSCIKGDRKKDCQCYPKAMVYRKLLSQGSKIAQIESDVDLS